MGIVRAGDGQIVMGVLRMVRTVEVIKGDVSGIRVAGTSRGE